MEFRDRKLCTLEGVVFSSCAIHASPRPSSTHCLILDACGFSATLLFPNIPFSFTLCCFLGHMYHFLLPDARCIPYASRPISLSEGSGWRSAYCFLRAKGLRVSPREGRGATRTRGVRRCGRGDGLQRRDLRGLRPRPWAARRRRRRTAVAGYRRRRGKVQGGGS